MDFVDLQILPPSSWTKFEDLCLDVFRALWGDPYATKNGRVGQSQHGTDIWGSPKHAPQEIHGIQCKGKDVLYGARLTEAELEAEVTKALAFDPPLSCWILATTAPKDAVIEAVARRITARHAPKRLFKVRVFGWEDIRNLIADFDSVLIKHYSDQAPRHRQMLARLSQDVSIGNAAAAVTARTVDEFRAETQKSLATIIGFVERFQNPVVGPTDASDVVLHARIDDIRTLIQERQPITALRRLDQLIADCWQSAPNFLRFRLRANKAAALSNLGRNEEAAEVSVEALQFAPNDARAIVYAAQGYFLLGNAIHARSMLDELLLREPSNDDAVAMRISVAVDEDAVRDPYWKVVDSAAVSWNVNLAAARWYRHREMHNECVAAVRRALAAEPDRLDVMAEAASFILEHLFRDKDAIFAHRLTSSQWDDLIWAVDVLDRVWEGVKGSEVRDTYLWSLFNLCTALRYIGRLDDAQTRIAEAVALAPHSHALLQQKALLEAATGQHEQLLLTLDAIGSKDAEACIMRSDALDAVKRPLEALAALDGVSEMSDPKLRIVAAGSKVRLLVSLGREDEALTVAKDIANTFAESALARLVISDFYKHTAKPEDALKEAMAAAEILKRHASRDGLDTVVVGEALAKLADWEGAADILVDVGEVQHDSYPLQLRVQALLNAGRRHELREILAKMPNEVLEKPHHARVAAWLFHLSGDDPQSRKHTEAYIRQVPKDLSMRLLWLNVVERQGDELAIQLFLTAELPYLQPGNGTRDLMALAQALARHGFPERGLDLGYRVLRDRWSNAKAHLGFLGLMMMVEGVQDAISSPSCIAPGVAFTVEDDVGLRRTYLVEAELNPKVELNEIASNSRLAKDALGLKVGDIISVNDSKLVPRQRIVELTHKYVSLLQRSLRKFNTLFPENNDLIGMSVDPAHPELFLEQITPALSARSAASREMLKQYRERSLPIAFAGRLIGLDPIDAWRAIRESNVTIDVCLGNSVERKRAQNIIENCPPLILDPVTFWITGALGLLDALAATFGPLGLTASTIELLAQKQKSALDNVLRGQGVMFERAGQINFAELTDAEKRAEAELLSCLLAWARTNAVLVPAIPDKDMAPEVRRLGEMAHPSVIDTISAASGSGRVLLCEDRRLRQLSEEAGMPKSVWLQPALSACFVAQSISKRGYDDVLLTLALWGHALTSLDGSAFLRATDRWGPKSLATFQKVAATLASPSLDVNSLHTVCLDFIQKLWTQPRARSTKESFTVILLASCRLGHPETPGVLLFLLGKVLTDFGDNMVRSDTRQLVTAQRFIQQWIRTNPV